MTRIRFKIIVFFSATQKADLQIQRSGINPYHHCLPTGALNLSCMKNQFYVVV